MNILNGGIKDITHEKQIENDTILYLLYVLGNRARCILFLAIYEFYQIK